MSSGLPIAPYENPQLSPDGQRVVATADGQIVVGDLARGLITPVTRAGGCCATWSPDGRRVAFVRRARLYVADVTTGPDSERPLWDLPFDTTLCLDWAPDGTGLALNVEHPGWDHDVEWLPLTSGSDTWPQAAAPRPLVRTRALEMCPRISPNGRFLAYTAREGALGRSDVFVQSIASAADRAQVSLQGGGQPRWSRDGREILFTRSNEMWAVPFQPTSVPTLGAPRRLPLSGIYGYDVAADGRLLVVQPDPKWKRTVEVQVIVNWVAEFAR